jgi:phosphopantothenoylcysteine decarboxylase/phosphopantothenate--cysteine ligase
VRFISNRSSGKMGYAVARSALSRGHEVVLISGPVALTPPEKARTIRVKTAKEMLAAAMKHIGWCDALIMVAAVCDWQPASVSARKLKKTELSSALPLRPTPDILKSLAPEKGRRVYVGFAAETCDLVHEAKRKLREKQLDLVVANDVSRADSGFEVDTNRAVLVPASGETRELPLLTKDALADEILQWVESAVHGRA